MKDLELLLTAGLASILATSSVAQPATDDRTPAQIALQSAIERVCLPVLEGQDLSEAAKTAGAASGDGGLDMRAADGSRVAISPPTSVNPTVCSLRLTFPAAQAGGLYGFMSRWSASRGLTARRTQERVRGPVLVRKTSTWEGKGLNGQLAIVLSNEETSDGQAVHGAVGEATILISRTPA